MVMSCPVVAPLPGSREYWGVAYGGGRYCAVGFDDAVASSEDGMNWTNMPPLEPDQYRLRIAACHAQGLFWAVGSAETIMSSPDCDTWTRRFPLPPGSGLNGVLTDVDSGGSTLVAVGESYPAPGEARLLIITSLDAGVTWTPVDHGIAAVDEAGYSWISVAYGNSRFVVQARDHSSPHEDYVALVSLDGMGWLEVPSPFVDPTEHFSDIAYADGLFVGVGQRIWTSPDGIIWTLRLDSWDYYLNGITHGPTGWKAVGIDGAVLKSADAITWVPETGATAHLLRAVVSAPNAPGYVAVGHSSIQTDTFIIFADGFESGDTSAW